MGKMKELDIKQRNESEELQHLTEVGGLTRVIDAQNMALDFIKEKVEHWKKESEGRGPVPERMRPAAPSWTFTFSRSEMHSGNAVILKCVTEHNGISESILVPMVAGDVIPLAKVVETAREMLEFDADKHF